MDISTPADCVAVIAVAAACLSLSWPVVVLRLFTRWRVVRWTGWDDWMMLISNVFFTIYCGAVINISRRVDSSPKHIQLGDLLESVDLLTVAEVFYSMALLALKISLGTFFLRLTVVRWQRRLIYFAVIVSTLFSIAMFFFAVLRCSRYDGALAFISLALQHECASDSAALGLTYTYGVVSAVTGWTFLILPFILFRLSLLTGREKWTLWVVFGFASISGIASLVRFKYMHGFAAPTQDFFVSARNIAIWSTIELGVGIIAGSLITLRPLIHRFSTSSSSTHSIAYQDIERRPNPDTKLPPKASASKTDAKADFSFPPGTQAQVPAYIAAYQNEKDRQPGNPWIVNFFNTLTNGKTKESGLPLDIFGTNALNTQSDDQDRDIESLRAQWRATTTPRSENRSLREKPRSEPESPLPDEHFRWDRYVRASRGWDKPLPPVPQDPPRRSLRWSQNPPHAPPPPLPQTVYAPPRGGRSGRRSLARHQHASAASPPGLDVPVPVPRRRRRDDEDGRGPRWDYVFNRLTETQKRDPALGLDIFGSSVFPSQSDDFDD